MRSAARSAAAPPATAANALHRADQPEAARIVAQSQVALPREVLPVRAGSTTLRWLPPDDQGRALLAHARLALPPSPEGEVRLRRRLHQAAQALAQLAGDL